MGWLEAAQKLVRDEDSGEIALLCDYIDDDRLRLAVCFAVLAMRDGTPPAHANVEAAEKFSQHVSDVAECTGQHAQRVRASKRARKARRTPNGAFERAHPDQWPAVGSASTVPRKGAGIAVVDTDTHEPLVELLEHPESVGRPWHYRIITTYGPDRVSWFIDGPEWWIPWLSESQLDENGMPKRRLRSHLLKDRGMLTVINGWKSRRGALNGALRTLAEAGWEVAA